MLINKKTIITSFLCFIMVVMMSTSLQGQNMEKQEFFDNMRSFFQKHPYRSDANPEGKSPQFYSNLLDKTGIFKDQELVLDSVSEENWPASLDGSIQEKISNIVTKAYHRIETIGVDIFQNERNYDARTLKKFYRAIIYYGNLELSRANVSTGRFHSSCFAIPTAAINTYFVLLPRMDAVESGANKNKVLAQANVILKKVAMQSWTQPFRNDETDTDAIQVERFRNHVWWVGGNALRYRPVFPTAIMLKSTKMLDVLSEVSIKALSSVSQNTYDNAFWIEGFTEDGLGWGHGKQCLVWGYPVDGTAAALDILSKLQDSPWEKKMEAQHKNAIFNYLRGSSWLYYKGYHLPANDRYSMEFVSEKTPPKSSVLTDKLEANWMDQLSKTEKKELLQFQETSRNHNILMDDYPLGIYQGTRWFYNNDNLVKKTHNYHIYISMASIRVDGIESASFFADKYNFFTCDGMTLFQKNGDEYHKAKGAWNITAIPGVTSRQAPETLTPIINWRGFNSKYNFCGAATHGNDAVSGFIHEKFNASDMEGVNDKTGVDGKNKALYGIRSHKFNFIAGDYMLSLGSGITNLEPKFEQDIWTTIDQTYWDNTIHVASNDSTYSIKDKHNKSIMLKKKGKFDDKTLTWVKQKGQFAYAIITEQTPGEVSLSLEHRKAKWKELNVVNKNKENLLDTVPVFQLNINHGSNPKDDTYGYIVYADNNNVENPFLENPFSILSNTTGLQAAKTVVDQLTAACFYDSKIMLNTGSWTMTANHPCLVLVSETKDSVVISVNDPTMNANIGTLVLETTLPVSGSQVAYLPKKKVYQINIDLPKGAELGKSISVELSKNKSLIQTSN